MTGKGKGNGGKGGKIYYGGKGKTAYDTGKIRVSSSTKAGLQFPVARIRRLLKETQDKRVTGPCAVYFAAVLEYMMAELLELAGNCAREVGRKRITPRHILLAIKNDDEMDKLLRRVIIVDGGVLPFIHWQLIPQKNAKKGGQSQEA